MSFLGATNLACMCNHGGCCEQPKSTKAIRAELERVKAQLERAREPILRIIDCGDYGDWYSLAKQALAALEEK